MDVLKMKSDHLTFLLKILQWLSIMCRIKSVLLGLAYTAFVSHVRLYINYCSELKLKFSVYAYNPQVGCTTTHITIPAQEVLL